MNKTKSIRQKKEYNLKNYNKLAWTSLKKNLIELKILFLQNYKNNFFTWKQFYNQHKNKQLKSIINLKFKKNKHKSNLMWKMLLRQINKFNNKNIIEDLDITIQENNTSQYINLTLDKMKSIYIQKLKEKKGIFSKLSENKQHKLIISNYVNNSYNKIMMKIQELLTYCNSQI